MISDRFATLFDRVALTASSNGSTYDFGAALRNVGPGERMRAVLQTLALADATDGNETYSFSLQVDDSPSFSSPTTLGTLVVPRGTAAGYRAEFQIEQLAWERYVRVVATLGGTTPSITISAWLTSDMAAPSVQRSYPAAYT
jgi:hypothetical protein